MRDQKLTTSAAEQSTMSIPPTSSPQRMWLSSRNAPMSSTSGLRGAPAPGRAPGSSGGAAASGGGGVFRIARDSSAAGSSGAAVSSGANTSGSSAGISEIG